MRKQELIKKFWREIGINCPDNVEPTGFEWIDEPTEMAQAAKQIEERKIASFCAERGIVLEP